MAVEDHVVVVFAEFAEPCVEWSELELAALLPELGAGERDGFIEVWMVLDGLGEGVADHPVYFGVRVFLFECGEDWGGAADITQGAWADDQDSLW